MRTVYYTASTLNGLLADESDSLDWLFSVPGPVPDIAAFDAGVTALVVGSTTYTWVLEHAGPEADAATWDQYFGGRPLFVFSSRDLPVPDGADVRILRGPVAEHLGALREAAGDGILWLQGGGDLAGQFADAGALDEIVISFAPATLPAGRPLLPRALDASRLELRDVERVGQFAILTYAVDAGNGAASGGDASTGADAVAGTGTAAGADNPVAGPADAS